MPDIDRFTLSLPARINILGNPADANEGDFATISAAIHLRAHAVIERAEDITDDTMRNAKAYRLTDQGRRVLKDEVRRLRSLVVLAERLTAV